MDRMGAYRYEFEEIIREQGVCFGWLLKRVRRPILLTSTVRPSAERAYRRLRYFPTRHESIAPSADCVVVNADLGSDLPSTHT